MPASRFQDDEGEEEDDWDEDPIFPIEDYDELLVSEILPLLPELDADELHEVREREESGKGRGFTQDVPKLAGESGAARALTEVLLDGCAHPGFQSFVEVVG